MQQKGSPILRGDSLLKKLRQDIRKNKAVYLLAIPVVLYYIIFHYLPMAGLSISFLNYRPFKGIFGSEFIGLKNFIDFFTSRSCWTVIRNTFTLNVYDILIVFPTPIILALLLNELRSKALKKGMQTAMYIPMFISMVVLCGIIKDFCESDGVIPQIIAALCGVETGNLLMKPGLYKTIHVFSSLWQYAGWNSIVYVAAIGSINMELYEAASVDGCGRWKRLFYVTLPGIAPTVITMFILRIGKLMSAGYEKIILLYNPLTYETADVISSYTYRMGLQNGDYGYATAVGLFNAVLNLIILITANKIARNRTGKGLW